MGTTNDGNNEIDDEVTPSFPLPKIEDLIEDVEIRNKMYKNVIEEEEAFKKYALLYHCHIHQHIVLYINSLLIHIYLGIHHLFSHSFSLSVFIFMEGLLQMLWKNHVVIQSQASTQNCFQTTIL